MERLCRNILPDRQNNMEGSAFVFFSFGKYFTMVDIDDLATQRQTYSGAGIFYASIEPLENEEYLLCKVLMEADAII